MSATRRGGARRAGAPGARAAAALLGATAAVAAGGAPAWAQAAPAPADRACRVTIAEAPGDVRAEIEAWVRAEPRCRRELEVRVVAAAGGLHLRAREPDGHVRERIVPDAQSAAVLVVSWMADDSIDAAAGTAGDAAAGAATGAATGAAADATPAPATPALPDGRGAPAGPAGALEPPARALLTPGGPGLAPTVVAAGEPDLWAGARPGGPGAGARRWLSLGAIASDGVGVGVRAQIDLLGGRWWSLGLAGGWLGADERGGRGGGMQDGGAAGQARIVAGAGLARGRLGLRAQLGLGVDLAASDDRRDGRALLPMSGSRDGDGALSPRLEAGLLGQLRVLGGWGLVGGPVLDAPLRDGDRGDGPRLSIFLGAQILLGAQRGP